MRRRDLLVGTAVTLCGLAGCVGSEFERLRAASSSAEYAPADDSSDGPDRDGTDAESDTPIEVGNPDDVPFLPAHPPHEVVLRNPGETERPVSVVITAGGGVESDRDDDGDDTDPLLEREFDLPAGERLAFVLVEPRSYTVTVRTSSDDGSNESTVTSGVDRHPFDCVRSRTTVTLSETGVRSESTSSSVPCPVPSVADTSLEIGERTCAGRMDGHQAVVEFADEAVIVDGESTTPTPCHDLSLAETEYDERRDALAITVAVDDEKAGTCVDCLGVADYEARIDLEGRYPGRVEVSHETPAETRQVTAVDYQLGE
ncbi:hypothetical protein [Natrinema longum]|uniref:Uncharacterized protein n=1 Tax=Natrinema longum TaxID=370324 RepID=A0A8A2UA62_9EURY|nr:hypothetical protein [Natrinema longum]MBZ6496618.1 hypothetical protein [Natrinema longum]QSW85483.1 hypothetical protein J0X27_01160 [Natrinema longum]